MHDAPGGGTTARLLQHITADINDLQFIARFQAGLRESAAFRRIHVAPGNYGEAGTDEDVAKQLGAIDFTKVAASFGSPINLFNDKSLRPFDLSTDVGCAKTLICNAAICSATMNFALARSSEEGFVPLADASPYRHLLAAKYARAMGSLEPEKNEIPLTDLSFAVFEELVPGNTLEKMDIRQVIRYRKASEGARQEFLGHMALLQATQTGIGLHGDYAGAIEKVVRTEIMPAARAFRRKLQTIEESLVGSIGKGVVGWAGAASAGMSVFGDLSWPTLLSLAGTAGAYVAKTAIDGVLAQRAARRECAISYLLSLDN